MSERRKKEMEGTVASPVRVVFATDFHLWHTPPVNRTDDYFSEVFGKLGQVLEEAVVADADIVILGGDLFHRPSPRLVDVNVVASLLSGFMKTNGIPVLACVGEHDIFGRQVSSYPAGHLGVLSFIGASIGADLDEPGNLYTTRISKRGGPGIVVACLPAPETRNDVDVLRSLNALWDKVEHSSDPPRVICFHHAIDSRDVPWTHIHPEDLMVPANSLVLCGDTHSGPDVFDLENGSKVVIPGAASRRTIDEKDRKPHFVIAEVDNETVSVELVPFRIHAPVPFVTGKRGFLQSLFSKKTTPPDGGEEVRPEGRRLSVVEMYHSKMTGSPKGLIDRGLEIIESILDEEEEDG